MAEEEDVWRKYPFIKSQVPRLHFDDPLASQLIKEQMPVILTDADIVTPAHKWDLDYLEQNCGTGKYAVFWHRSDGNYQLPCSCPQNNRASSTSSSESGNTGSSTIIEDHDHDKERIVLTKGSKKETKKRINVFKYYDDKKLQALQDKSIFEQQTVRIEMTFQEFVQKYKGERNDERVYLQQPLSTSVGRQIAADFIGFNWSWLVQKQNEWKWGPLTSNLLLVGQKGNVTPCHYDEQHNLFCQIKGIKRFLLFPPDNFKCLYPYPVYHPHDRQSQVDLDDPDTEKYPNFKLLHGVEAVLKPGEILYIPIYWWHHVINVEDTIAVNFWHMIPQQNKNDPIPFPLHARHKVAICRNIEKMLIEALRDERDVNQMLHWLMDSRF